MKIGKIKWYGGLNNKTGKDNKFGFISELNESERLNFNDNNDFRVLEKNIKCDYSLLKKDVVVLFEAIIKDDRKEAINVDLMGNHYGEIIEILEGTVNSFEFCPDFIPYHIYDSFSVEDKRLAMLWYKSWLKNNAVKNENAIKAKMLSARGAEIAAIKFYKLIGCDVEDISIKQITNKSSEEWINHDLNINSHRFIDIKNARTSANNNGYSEYYVPEFKQGILGQSVSIGGVLSPAVRYDELSENIEPYTNSRGIKISFLGESTIEEINYLTKKYSEGGLLELTLSREITTLDNSSFIAPWLFDYPKDFYNKNVVYKQKLKHYVLEDSYLINDYAKLNKINLIPCYIAANIELSDEVFSGMHESVKNLYLKIVDHGIDKLNLPNLFLLILTEFLDQAKNNFFLDYSPSKYKYILFYSNKHPLGIYDPLDLIDTLINNLEKLWNGNKALNYSEFIGFKLTGKGLLTGKHRNGDVITLLAYCGGVTEQKVSCGFNPLIRGVHRNCNYCKKLICGCCDFCSKNCERQNDLKNIMIVNSSTELIKGVIRLSETRSYGEVTQGMFLYRKIKNSKAFEIVGGREYSLDTTFKSVVTDETIYVSSNMSNSKKT